MQQSYEEIRELGADVVAVSFEPLQRLKKQVEDMRLPFPILSDPGLETYRAYGVRRGSFGDVFNLGAALQFLRLLFKGRWVWAGHGDIMQLGGDFIISQDGLLKYSHPASSSQDQADVDALLEELRRGQTQPTSPGRA